MTRAKGDGQTCTLIDATRTAVSREHAKESPRAKLQEEHSE
jgi:hypothetical protein